MQDPLKFLVTEFNHPTGGEKDIMLVACFSPIVPRIRSGVTHTHKLPEMLVYRPDTGTVQYRSKKLTGRQAAGVHISSRARSPSWTHSLHQRPLVNFINHSLVGVTAGCRNETYTGDKKHHHIFLISYPHLLAVRSANHKAGQGTQYYPQD